MDLPDLLLIATALSLDCFAVSLAGGTPLRTRRARTAAMTAISFGLFQAGMTVAGWTAGAGVVRVTDTYGPAVAFLLLAGVGIKMLIEARHGEEGETIDLKSLLALLVLSVATSIDAFAVGISFAILHEDVIHAAAMIGAVASVLSLIGVLIGVKLGALLGRWAEAVGGVILVAIGFRILAGGYF